MGIVYDIGKMRLFVIPDAYPIEVSEFRSNPPNVVPDLAKNLVNLRRRLFGKSSQNVGAAKIMP